MQVGHHVGAGIENFEESVSYIRRFERTEPQSFKTRQGGYLGCHIGQAVSQIRLPVFAASGCLAVCSQKNARQNNFFMTGGNQVAGLVNYFFYVLVTNPGAYFRYNTIGQ